MTLTQNGSTYTVTPANGFYGTQYLEVMAFTPLTGQFQLQVGATMTANIAFDSTNLSGTAANIQTALLNAGFTGATVTVATSTVAPNFNFDVNFGSSSQSPISYVAGATAMPVTFANSSAAASATQELTILPPRAIPGTAAAA